jgi:hypothetical protein
MGVVAGRALLVAAACSGCLSAPSSNDAGGGDQDGDPDAAAPCAVILADDFAGDIAPGVWASYVDNGGTIVPDTEADTVTLAAPGGAAFAGLTSSASLPIANTILEARFSADTGGDGEVFFMLEVDELNSLSFFIYHDQLVAELEVDDTDTGACDTCPLHDDGDTISVRITAGEDSAQLEWAGSDGDYVPLGTSDLVAGQAQLKIHAYALETSTASVTVDQVTWRDCNP